VKQLGCIRIIFELLFAILPFLVQSPLFDLWPTKNYFLATKKLVETREC